MTRLELLVASVWLVCLLEVGMADILMSFGSKPNKGAVRTLTRESLLGLRQAALKPDISTCRRIALLGCIGRRRGCRAGRNKTKHKQQAGIPVIVGRHQIVLHVPVGRKSASEY